MHQKLSAADKAASTATDLHQKLEQLAAVQNELNQSKSEVANLQKANEELILTLKQKSEKQTKHKDEVEALNAQLENAAKREEQS